jgi:signal transduction histidine kinase/DNA-binding response OmpR family regulator
VSSIQPREPSASSVVKPGGDMDCLAGGGEMGARMRAIDWAQTPLGAVESWPQNLQTCVRIVLTSRQPMFVWWGDELINLYNDAYRSIVGGKHPEALGQPASVVWREIWDEAGPRARATMGGIEGTYDEALLLIMERNGYPEETYYTFSYSPVPNERGGTGGLICANTDDTRRILSERQFSLLGELGARASTARSVEAACALSARALATNPRDLTFALLYLIDEDKGIAERVGAAGIALDHEAAPAQLKLNEQAYWPVAEVMRSGGMRVLHMSADRATRLPRGAWTHATRDVAVVPMAAPAQSGRSGVLVVGLNPLRLFDDVYSGFIGLVAGQIAAAIASADAYQQERRRAEELAALDRAKTTFFSNVSHEFRTPLTLMLGPLQDAMSGARKLSPENLEIAYRNALRLLKLVNALLDFSRIEAGRADASFEAVELAGLTADLASAFRSAIERAGLRFDVQLSPLSAQVYVDVDMWEKIVLNLLSNALKFTFEGTIHIGLKRVDEHVELCVRDTGSGIPSHELPQLFERFHRVQGAQARTHEGSGIGLAMVHELVRLHGGSIAVRSELGQGSEFVVSIPLGSAHLPPDALQRKRQLSSTGLGAAPFVQEAQRWLPTVIENSSLVPAELASPSLPPHVRGEGDAGARILLADDNADMRDYVARLLRERWQVEACADGAKALESALRQPPDLVITDVMMPLLDGFALLSALRADARTRTVPVLVLTARAGEESRLEALEAGVDDYLVKPFSARELLARVGTHLALSRFRALAERERQRLYDVFMQAPVPVAVLFGAELRFAVANAHFCALTGRSELVGQTVREAFSELGAHPGIAGLEQVMQSGKPFQVTELSAELVRDGQRAELYLNYAAQPLNDEHGATIGVIAVVHDVTDQVLARRKVDGLRDAAERASRAKDEFLSTLSHELRTPLSAIVGWSTLLRKGAVPAERMEKALETIERNAKVQARLIEDMLDLARIEQGKLMLSVGPLEMVRVVSAAIDSLRPAAEAKGVRLQSVLDSHATIVGDADRLQQVVWNLLSNAIKFTPKAGRVHVRLQRHHSYVELAVADTGQGIDGDFLPHVFDRFRQADASFARRAGGLGLGLAIVRSLVELHGGTVTATSAGKDQGAEFVVRLPVAPLRADTVPLSGERDAGIRETTFDAPPELRGLRVLVLDDEAETRELLRFVLEQCEVRVTCADHAVEALRLLGEEPFDLLISDIGMPDMDGYALIRAVRSLPEGGGGSIPALALTAYARAEDRTQVLRAGFHMHLAKPIDPSELLVVLATLVNGYLRRS